MAVRSSEKYSTDSSKEENGVFDFTDGGRYIGEWRDGHANGHGVCIGPMDSGVFQGKWVSGSQVSGVFRWSNGQRYMGTWKDGTRHGMGKEIRPDGTEFVGDFRENTRGPFGVLKLSSSTGALYQGTWEEGLQDGVGVEVYADKGVYRGQYKKGLRNGYGTRSSYSHEFYEKTLGLKPDKTDSPVNMRRAESLKRSINSDEMIRSNSSSSLASRSMKSVPENSIRNGTDELKSQIYEGQWYKDKRHGHGVLRASGNYMYCGEWSLNDRTGNGILIHEDGRREEGTWEKGRLVVPLKRKKLSIKYHQLEVKVKQAHTLALQAADAARTKAMLAESRASAAANRAELGLKAAEDANKNADTAKEKADLLYDMEHCQQNATTPSIACTMNISESIVTPSLDEEERPRSTSLNVPKTSPSPSLENLDGYSRTFSCDSIKSDSSKEDSVSINDELRSISETSSIADSNIYVTVNERRESHAPLPSFPSPLLVTSLRRRASTPHDTRRRRSSDNKLEKQPSSPAEFQTMKEPSLTRIDDSTGEIVTVFSDEVATATSIDSSVLHHTRLPDKHPPQPDQAAAVSMDVLKQMANWNKTVAYINFVLLLFLLLLIVFVVAFLSTTISQNNPASFMNQMA